MDRPDHGFFSDYPPEPGDSPGRHPYDATWVDHFWGWTIEGIVFARSLAEAIERALESTADGLPIDRLEGRDGVAERVSGGHTVRAARVLVEIEGVLFEDVLPALTREMAIDLAELVFGPTVTVVGLQEGGHIVELQPFAAYVERRDWPLGW